MLAEDENLHWTVNLCRIETRTKVRSVLRDEASDVDRIEIADDAGRRDSQFSFGVSNDLRHRIGLLVSKRLDD